MTRVPGRSALALVVSMAGLGACSGATPGALTSTPPPLLATGGGSSVARSIGDVIVGSSAVVDGTVVGFREPIWNSPDGHNWRDEYNADPGAFVTIPLQATPVRISINDVLSSSPDARKVEAGGQLDVLFVGPGFVAGERRVWFLEWTQFFQSDGTGRDVWYGDDDQLSWVFMPDGLVQPANDAQGFSLAEGAFRGLAKEAVVRSDGKGAMPIAALEGLVRDELTSNDVDVAGFEQWPPEPAYRRAMSSDRTLSPAPPTDDPSRKDTTATPAPTASPSSAT